jgi:hypothetical protein
MSVQDATTGTTGSVSSHIASLIPHRNSSEAHRIARETYPFQCCAVCGIQLPASLDVAHLDQNGGNNKPDNLAFLCHTHHWMFDGGLYPIEAIKMLRAHWQETKGVASWKARMKDAGPKAALRRKRREAARKAVEARQRRLLIGNAANSPPAD